MVGVTVADFFKDLMAEDDSVHVTVLMDQGIYIDMVVNSVLQNLGYGAVSYTHLDVYKRQGYEIVTLLEKLCQNVSGNS